MLVQVHHLSQLLLDPLEILQPSSGSGRSLHVTLRRVVGQNQRSASVETSTKFIADLVTSASSGAHEYTHKTGRGVEACWM